MYLKFKHFFLLLIAVASLPSFGAPFQNFVPDEFVEEEEIFAGVALSPEQRRARAELFKAAQEGNLKGVREAIERKGVPVTAIHLETGYTALHYAAANGHVGVNGKQGVVDYLVEIAHAYVDAEDFYGATPLHYAALNGHQRVESYLVKEARARLDAKDDNGETPLIYALRGGHSYIANDLMYYMEQQGIEIYPNTIDLLPFLHYAAKIGNFEIVEFIVCTNADVNKPDELEQKTPLMYAAQGGYKNIVEYLVEKAGAKIALQDGWGKTAIDYALENGHEKIAKYLTKELEKQQAFEEAERQRQARAQTQE